MVLTPIEVAIEDVQKKICELDAAITQVTLTSGHVFAREQSSAPLINGKHSGLVDMRYKSTRYSVTRSSPIVPLCLFVITYEMEYCECVPFITKLLR